MVNKTVTEIKKDFLYPIAPYHGQDYLHGMVKNRKLQEFTAQVNYITALHTNGKLSSSQAYEKIEQLWQILNS